MIVDGRMAAEASPVGAGADPRAYLLACYPEAEIAPLNLVAPTAGPLVARVNHGRWIASCSCGMLGLPRPGCIVFLDVLLGWCVRCGNGAWGGGWRRIVAPEPDERRLIEAVLLCRPNVGDRNWEPGETVELLAAENAAHGDPVPDLDVVRIGPVHGPSLLDLAPPFPTSAEMAGGLKWRRRGLRRFLGR